MNESKIFRLIVLTFGLVLTLAVSAKAVSSEAAPNFTVTTLDGKTITKASLEGKPTLLMFWASWCHTCQGELPNVKTLYDQHRAKGLQTVAIGFQDQRGNGDGLI